jgi:hypothetical protein
MSTPLSRHDVTIQDAYKLRAYLGSKRPAKERLRVVTDLLAGATYAQPHSTLKACLTVPPVTPETPTFPVSADLERTPSAGQSW